jgi:hypothetical protein
MTQKWVSFTYSGSYIQAITRLLKNTKTKIAFKTTNTLGNILRETLATSKYEQIRIYKLTSMECRKSYIWQTGRSLNIRYKEHLRSIKSNREYSRYTTHILRNSYRYRKIKEITEKIDHARKGRIMNIKENLYIYIDAQRSHDNNNKNALFDTAMTYRHAHLVHPLLYKMTSTTEHLLHNVHTTTNTDITLTQGIQIR